MSANSAAKRTTARWLASLRKTAGSTAKIALLMPLAAGVVLVGQTFVLARLLSDVLIEGADPGGAAPLLAVLAALFGARVVLNAAGEIMSTRASESAKLELRRRMWQRILSNGPIWSGGKASGTLGAIMVEHVEALDGHMVRYAPAVVQAAVLPVVFGLVALSMDWAIGALFLASAPAIPVAMAFAGIKADKASRDQATALTRLSARFADRLRGMVTLKLFGREHAESQAMHDASEELRRRSMRVMKLAFVGSTALELIAAIGIAAVGIYVGLSLVGLVALPGTGLTLETGLFCLLLAPEIYQPWRTFAAHYHDGASAKAAALEIESTLGSLPDPSEPGSTCSAVPAHHSRGAIALTAHKLNVFSPSGRRVLSGVDIDIAAGSHNAILGASGSGKSTLIEAIAGLREFDGALLFDGRPLSQIDAGELRHRVALLGQRPRIFRGTIADNIRFGREGASEDSVRTAARLARVSDFTESLPMGLDTPLGENGYGLSGGEATRVALARIFLRDPGLVLLDEPTANLDASTEAKVIDGILEFAEGRTLLVVTHSSAVAARMQKAYRVAGAGIFSAVRPQGQQLEAKKGAA